MNIPGKYAWFRNVNSFTINFSVTVSKLTTEDFIVPQFTRFSSSMSLFIIVARTVYKMLVCVKRQDMVLFDIVSQCGNNK